MQSDTAPVRGQRGGGGEAGAGGLRVDELLMVEDVQDMLRASCERRGGAGEWARWAGVSPSYVSDVLAGRRAPGEKILFRLSLERVTRYRLINGAAQ